MQWKTFVAIGIVLLAACSGCYSRPATPTHEEDSSFDMSRKTMKLTSSAIVDGERMDNKYTVEGDDISPPLSWSDVPAGTISLALICDDPDAPSPARPAADPWVHWVLFNIPSDVTELPPGIEPTEDASTGTRRSARQQFMAQRKYWISRAGSATWQRRTPLCLPDLCLGRAAGSPGRSEQTSAGGSHVGAHSGGRPTDRKVCSMTPCNLCGSIQGKFTSSACENPQALPPNRVS